MRAFFLLFITIPILEMWVLIKVGSQIGALPTIALVFLTAAIGLALLRQQGLDTLLRVNQRMAEGQLPAQEILEGVLLAIGGALLLTPGFITDAFGFACLIPPSRKWLVSALLRQGVVMAGYGRQQQTHSHERDEFIQGSASSDSPFRSESQKNPQRNASGDTIEGEFRRDD